MTQRALSLASGVLPEFGPEATAAAAAATGYDATGLWVDLETWTPSTTRTVRSVLGDAGLFVLDVEVIWIKPGAPDPNHFRIIDVGAEVGARNVLIVSSDPDLDATADKFTRLVDHGDQCGVRASLEFGVFTEVKTLQDALSVLERCGRSTGGLLVDPLHLARSGGRPADLARVPRERFAYAQFCDAPEVGPSPEDAKAIVEEALDLRLAPAQGALPLAELLDILPPGAPLSLEVRSRKLRDDFPDPVERARTLLSQTRTGLDRLTSSSSTLVQNSSTQHAQPAK